MPLKKFGNKKIRVRKLNKRDLEQPKKFQDFINSLVKEDVMILMNSKKTQKEEKDWVKEQLDKIARKKKISLVAECEGRIVGGANLELWRERKNHIAEFGITIRDGYRGIGLGQYLMAKIIQYARCDLQPCPKIIRLSVYEGNDPAIGLYKKMGFREAARIPKQIQFQGKLIDEIVMLLEL
ncbi:MAG: GNAT family N-acetyltransferase [Patescibacteria group bacterium]|nr:GNAT family N-acetyltransferase [Patescibacteria group bacterium]